MVCYSTASDLYGQSQTTVFCPASTMMPRQRRELALEALAGSETISQLARQHQVSRKFVYQQAAKAEEVIDEAFRFAPRSDAEAIFHLPVSKAWLRQLVLGLTLICHSSIRGVEELLRDVFDCPISVGTVLACQIGRARRSENEAVTLADEVSLLFDWLRYDILSLAGPDYAARRELYDFVVAELWTGESLCPHRIGPVVRALTNQRDQLLAFAARLDQDLAALALQFQLPVATLRAVFNIEALPADSPARWPREAALRERRGGRFFAVGAAVAELVGRTTRASSVIENFNSRLRGYFFLRRHLGLDYLALLQFFLNHRRFLRSERPERVGKSPAELLSGEVQPHWLEMLGYVRFSRN